MSKEAKTQSETPAFGKEQILSSKSFTALEKDVLQALLADGQEYTLAQARTEIEEYVKRSVE